MRKTISTILIILALGCMAFAAQWTPPTALWFPIKLGIVAGDPKLPPQQARITYCKDCDFFVPVGTTFERDYNLSGYPKGVHIAVKVTPK